LKEGLKGTDISHIWKVYRIFIFHPILMQIFFFNWSCWELLVNRFPLSLTVLEIISTKRGQQKLNSKIITFLFFIQF